MEETPAQRNARAARAKRKQEQRDFERRNAGTRRKAQAELAAQRAARETNHNNPEG